MIHLLVVYPCEAWIKRTAFLYLFNDLYQVINSTDVLSFVAERELCPRWLGTARRAQTQSWGGKAVGLAVSGSCLRADVATWLLVSAERGQGLLVFTCVSLRRYILSLQWPIRKTNISFLHKRLLWGKRKSVLRGDQVFLCMPCKYMRQSMKMK